MGLIHTYIYNYRASIAERVKQFTVQASTSQFAGRDEFSAILTCEKAGCSGEGKITFSFVSIEITSSMVGLSAAFSWTQSSATLMYLFSIGYDASFCNMESINSQALPSFHRFHAWKSTEHSNAKWMSQLSHIYWFYWCWKPFTFSSSIIKA